MQFRRIVIPFVLAILCSVGQSSAAAKAGKLRVLVDKVLAREFRWQVTEEVILATKAAGFNVFCPRRGANDPERVRHVAELTQKHGLSCLTWMRGTLSAKKGCRLVWQNGSTHDIYSPNADELWDWMSKQILMHARVSREFPSLMGVFLDYEIYAKPWLGWAYPLSYDERILSEFGKARGIEIPRLEPKQRHPWLVEQKLHDAFAGFQVASWRARCRKLRREVDALNPRFRFCVYPGPRGRLINEAILAEWATRDAPIVLASADTYGRPRWYADKPLKSHAEALAINRQALLNDLAYLKKTGIPHLYMGGIDPAVRGADPEFSGHNAIMISETTDGYWIFYEGIKVGQPGHHAYWDWSARANRAIREGDFTLWKQPRKTPDLYDDTRIVPKTKRIQVGAYNLPNAMLKLIEEADRYEVRVLKWTSTECLEPLDVVILEDYSHEPWQAKRGREWVKKYAEGGGRLFLTHDTAALLGPVFKAVAVAAPARDGGDVCGRLKHKAMTIDNPDDTLSGIRTATSFETTSKTHWVLAPGSSGKVVLRNRSDAPVCAVGAVGKARIAISGCSYGGEQAPSELEATLFLSILEWLSAGAERGGE